MNTEHLQRRWDLHPRTTWDQVMSLASLTTSLLHNVKKPTDMVYQESCLSSAEDLFLPIHSQELHRVLHTPLGSIESNSILCASGTAQTSLHIFPYILLSVYPCDKCTHASISTPTSQVYVDKMGLEPTTLCLQSRCSSQLSYKPINILSVMKESNLPLPLDLREFLQPSHKFVFQIPNHSYDHDCFR